MNIQQAYNTWADTYDSVLNKTRDLEARAIRSILDTTNVAEIVELGCGTGKNTQWLATKATHVTAVDFSAQMLDKAKEKLQLPYVTFQQGDITQEWHFVDKPADLITCSLILEHIQDLTFVFKQAYQALQPNGLFYIGELHPFKQYQGSKARFDTATGGVFELECHVHHISDYTEGARQNGFTCVTLQEWFDEENRAGIPRIASFLFRKG
ncbi:class I SAM-dependent DNA methyltransferase [Hymenobacter volaticus]|uniref:Class I SAM-dependent methyltransferase n=1 Tax=Hymenobacter volaticus TaxID=2932254 RepID=A0ABY4G8P2_9BACT|nr:class I SAM-dependent methyltransferase [Hymenobacter volaticus]UOQ67275.1 class I SAM-dependent methyltransferase [Hymenobacter volaticus]